MASVIVWQKSCRAIYNYKKVPQYTVVQSNRKLVIAKIEKNTQKIISFLIGFDCLAEQGGQTKQKNNELCEVISVDDGRTKVGVRGAMESATIKEVNAIAQKR